MSIVYERNFSKEGPFTGLNFIKRLTEVTKPDGTVVFQQDDVEAPDFWSDRALRTAAQKYFVRPGVSTTYPEGETSVKQMCANVAMTIAESGFAQGYFTDMGAKAAFEDDLLWLLIRQYGAFNSPVWFNCRRWHAYMIEGKGGNWAWDVVQGHAVQTENAYERPQCSACFLTPVENSIVDGDASIMAHLATEARIFKYGSGSGTNFSKIQEKNSRTSSGGKASGLLTFLKPGDAVAGVIKSGGTTRRAAKMICVDLDHPEVEDFIDLKMREEKKALILAEHGYGRGMEDESYTTVTGQNANNSVRAPDAFFEAVERDGEWHMTSRVGGAVVKTVKAQDLMLRIATATWSCADPGVHYDSAQQYWHTCKNSGRINTSNPCSEYLFLDDTACNLASLKLTAFLLEDGTLDVPALVKAVRVFIIAQDILVDLSSYPTKAVAENSHKFRTLGLGYMDLGTLLMLKGLAYDSDEGRSFAAAVTSLIGAVAYETSTELADSMGTFTEWAKNEEPMQQVINAHWAQSVKAMLPTTNEARSIFVLATTTWGRVATDNTGFRNAQVTLLAPTGTIGFLADAETTGVEPAMGLMLYKELAGGGTVELPNRTIGEALHRLGYTAIESSAIIKYVNENLPVPGKTPGTVLWTCTGSKCGHTFEVPSGIAITGAQCPKCSAHNARRNTYKRGAVAGAPGLKAEHYSVFDCAFPPPHAKAPFIRPEAHVLMMSAVQPFLSGAISKTINMPKESTVEDIRQMYMLAWKEGLKAVAIYRDESKGGQPVTTTLKGADVKADVYADVRTLPLEDRIKHLIAVGVLPSHFGTQKKLPKKRRGTTQDLTIDGQKLFFRSGEYLDGSLGEVFIDVKNDGSTVSGLAGALARSISLGLQYGTPLEAYADQLLYSRFEPHGMVGGHESIKSAQSIVDLLMRWLMIEYTGAAAEPLKSVKSDAATELDVPQFTGDGPPCTTCGHITKRNGACYRCPNCSETSGCS